jgi:hypothetical protein
VTDDAESERLEPTELKFVGPATAESLSTASFGPEAIRHKTVSFSMLLDAGVNPGVAARIRREHSLPWSFETEDRQDLDRRSDQIRGLGDGERAWVAASSGDWAESETDADTPDAGTADDDTPDDDTPDLPGDWAVPEPEDGRRPEEIDLSTEIGSEDEDNGSVDAVVPTPDAGPDETDSEDDNTETGASDAPAGSTETGASDAPAGSTVAASATEADGSGDPVAAESAWRRRSAPTPVSALDGVDESVQSRLADAGITSVRSLANADPAAVAAALDMTEAAVAELRDSATAYTE